MRQNDTAPFLQATLKDENGLAVDLTGATVVFSMRDASTQTLKVNESTANVTSPTDGEVQYEWNTGDTDTVGSYEAEFEVTYSDSTIETFPNTTYIEIDVIEEVA